MSRVSHIRQADYSIIGYTFVRCMIREGLGFVLFQVLDGKGLFLGPEYEPLKPCQSESLCASTAIPLYSECALSPSASVLALPPASTVPEGVPEGEDVISGPFFASSRDKNNLIESSTVPGSSLREFFVSRALSPGSSGSSGLYRPVQILNLSSPNL
jgi:hypothetical protein